MMMNTTNQGNENRQGPELEALFQHVSARKRAPAEVEQNIRSSLHSEWRQMTGKHRKRRRVTNWAIAASVLLALFLSTNLLRQTDPVAAGAILASVMKKTGDGFQTLLFRVQGLKFEVEHRLLHDQK